MSFSKTDWESLLKISLNDVNFSFEQFLLKLNNLLDIHVPFKYLKRKNEKHNKPWIANGIANSIRKKIICIKNYAEQRTLKERKNFTNYIKPIKTM